MSQILKEILRILIMLILPFLPKMLAQPTAEQPCWDKVYLHDGSIFVGKMIRYHPDSTLKMVTRNGYNFEVSVGSVRKIKQRCPHEKDTRKQRRDPQFYNFRERGWWQHTRIATLPGINWANHAVIGLGLQHIGGFQFSRKWGAGLGVGSEIFSLGVPDVVTYPVFAEMRGYFLSKKSTPYYAVGAGWAFVGNEIDDDFSNKNTLDWRGGWSSHIRLGYRLGNHFTFDFGCRWQAKTHEWTSRWQAGEVGRDRILHQRLEIGLGFLF